MGDFVLSFQKWDPSPPKQQLAHAWNLFLSHTRAHMHTDAHVSSTRREVSPTFCVPQTAAGWTIPLIWQQSPHRLPHCLSFVCSSMFSALDHVDVGLDVCFCVLLGSHQQAPSIPVLSLKYGGGDAPASKRKRKQHHTGSFLFSFSLSFLSSFTFLFPANTLSPSHVLHVKLQADLSCIWLPLIAHNSIQCTLIRHSTGAILLSVPWWLLQGVLWRRDLLP